MALYPRVLCIEVCNFDQFPILGLDKLASNPHLTEARHHIQPRPSTPLRSLQEAH
jgi:hypothetical protein